MARCAWVDGRGQCGRQSLVDQGYCPGHIIRARGAGLVEPPLGELSHPKIGTREEEASDSVDPTP